MRKFFLLLFVLLSGSAAFGQGTGYTFTSIDVPVSGAVNTKAFRINARGDIVGRYFVGTDGPHGFLRNADGTFTAPIDVPVANTGTVCRGINSAGDIVGRYFDLSGFTHGFLLGKDGTFTTIDVPSTAPLFGIAGSTVAEQINNLGEIVGHYDAPTAVPGLGTIPAPHGFLRHTDGSFTRIDPPGAGATIAKGINDVGVVVGAYFVPGSSIGTIIAHGFSLSASGQYTTVDVPASTGASGTGINATNDASDLVGFYATGTVTIKDLISDSIIPGHGFLMNNNNGTFITLDVSLPGVTVFGQNFLGVNARGDIVGVYVDGSSAEHGFLATR